MSEPLLDALRETAKQVAHDAAEAATKKLAEQVLEGLKGHRRPLSERLLTVKELSDRCPGITHAALRKWIANAETNGLARKGAVVRPDNRTKILIDQDRFDEWLEEWRSPGG